MLNTITYTTLNIGPHPYPEGVIEALAAVAGMAPQPDANGNMQGVYRLDLQPDGTLLLTYPASVIAQDVLNAIAAAPTAAPPITPQPTPAEAAAQVAQTLNTALGTLNPSTATPADIISTLQGALQPVAGGIL